MNDSRPDIWLLQTRFDLQGLIDALSHTDAAIRRRSAAALRALGATEAIPHLKKALDNEQDTDTRAALLAALATLESDSDQTLGLIVEPPADSASGLPTIIKPPKEEAPPAPMTVALTGDPVLEPLLERLKGTDDADVIAAVEQLTALRNKRAAEPLVILFDNTKQSDDVRLAAAEALLALESAPVDVVLLGTLRSANWRVRRNGAAILGQIRASWAVKPLAVALKDEHEIVRRTAQAALKRINTPAARLALGVTRQAGEGDVSRKDTRTLNTTHNSPTQPAKPSAQRIRDAAKGLKKGTLPDAPTQKLTPSTADIVGDNAPSDPADSHTAPTSLRPPANKPKWPRRTGEASPRDRATKDLNPKTLDEAQDRIQGKKNGDD